MTLYISDSEKKAKSKRGLVAYIAITIFCIIFSTVYEYFSHQVYSDYMIYVFAYPLIGGIIPFLLLRFTKLPYPPRISLNALNSGVATLAVGSAMCGVLEIYGTTSNLTRFYWIAGIAFASFGLISWICSLFAKQKK